MTLNGARPHPWASPAPDARFPRVLRLKRRALLRPLFRKGQSLTAAAGGVRILFRQVPRVSLPYPVPLQVAFVPGRQPSAVVRNRVRRTLREVYRCHHGHLVDLLALPETDALAVAVLFRGTVAPDLYARLSNDLPRALARMADIVAPPRRAAPTRAPVEPSPAGSSFAERSSKNPSSVHNRTEGLP